MPCTTHRNAQHYRAWDANERLDLSGIYKLMFYVANLHPFRYNINSVIHRHDIQSQYQSPAIGFK